MTSATASYPVRVRARLDPHLNRWLWLVKWFLAIPHYVVLAFLWLAFSVVSVVAFFAILFTGRYPRPLFDFNLGVLRWSWRVAYYTYGALATDRYPPFSLDEEPDYPATLDIAYPRHLSRGLVLVKWWLLAIPHYVVIGLFIGGTGYAAARAGDWTVNAGGGLVGILALVAGVVLLFTGRYPRGVFDFVLGMDRWVLRVAAYAGLMTDAYPPFRLDTGGDEPAVTIGGEDVVEPPPPGPTKPWGAGRTIAVVLGALLIAGGGALATGGAFAVWADQTQRDQDGFVSTAAEPFHSDGYAVEFATVDVHWTEGGWASAEDWLGDVRLRVRGDSPVFIGIGPSDAVADYLRGVERDKVTNLGSAPFDPAYDHRTGGAPSTPPESQDFWVASTSGADQTLRWQARTGSWTAVLMNADGSRTVDTTLSVGATAPALGWIAFALLLGGGVVLLLGVTLVVLGAWRPRDPAVPAVTDKPAVTDEPAP